MLILAILKLFQGLTYVMFGWLPDGSLLPTFGSVNIDTIFATGLAYFRYLEGIFPPFTTIAICASLYLGFRLVLIIIKLVIGSRTPVAH